MQFLSSGGSILACPSTRLWTPYGQRLAQSPHDMHESALVTVNRLMNFKCSEGTLATTGRSLAHAFDCSAAAITSADVREGLSLHLIVEDGPPKLASEPSDFPDAHDPEDLEQLVPPRSDEVSDSTLDPIRLDADQARRA